MMTKPEIEEGIRKLRPFFQNIEVCGLDTRERTGNYWSDNYPSNLYEFVYPMIKDEVISGKVVLDIGCNAGYFSFKFEKLGGLVWGIDIEQTCSNMKHNCIDQANFLNKCFGSSVIFEKKNFFNVNHSGFYDFILFMGVLYHIPAPDCFNAVPHVASLLKPGGCLIFETAFDYSDKIYGKDSPHGLYHNDETNFFVPSLAWIWDELKKNKLKVEKQKTYEHERILIKARKDA
jgi:2-polyprenyl-3-methyl-5-hydroxy-6-metoxy-1,4-benzoquinol methylase